MTTTKSIPPPPGDISGSPTLLTRFRIASIRFPLALAVFCIPLLLKAQDEITLKNGDIIQAHVQEVSVAEVKCVAWDNQEGPIYSLKKTDIFMIKYNNGQKDVFTETAAPGGPPASIFFFRPKKFAGGAPEIIVATAVPDEVIVKVHNGSWYKAEYTHFGDRSFVTGVYAINPESFNYRIESGKTYYIRCTLHSHGFKMMSKLELVDEDTAKKEMAELKHQMRNW